jgi:hypothetical protein
MGMLEGKIFPSGSVFTIVLAHGSPGALGKIRSPSPPVPVASGGFDEAKLLSVHIR